MKRLVVPALITLSGLGGPASGQQALAKEYGYKLAGQTSEAAYFLSGIRRGTEPGSVQAWVWTVSHLPSPSEADHDAKAQLAVLRCEGRSVEILKTELYRDGVLLNTTDEPPSIPKDVKSGTAMELAWQVGCDMERRFSATTFANIADVYQAAR